ncbi:ACB Acyl-CoA-binding protein [Pyrenophora tritici-repentis]|nr:ACB Acyl-CoA-binding protein [Pyrenophora tritici-repentis]
MADKLTWGIVDRVFSHALNTVNKIRTGSQKPPSATRLRLYGLYKQAMEGDVDGIMECPKGSDDQSQRAREKWDAWKQQNGLSRTEAKRRYITTLIDTMHKYASPSPDSRELVAELEFVWDQVKSNVPSSSSSSPLRTLDHIQSGYSQHELGQSGRAAMGMKNTLEYDRSKRNSVPRDEEQEQEEDSPAPMRVKSPMSQSEEALEEEEANIDREVFVDAPDSQYNPTSYPDDEPSLEDAAVQTDLQQLMRAEPIPMQTPTPAPRNRGMAWKKRVEQSLMKMTAEVAALREQLEARRLFAHSAHYRLFRGIWRWVSACVRHIAVDVFILGIR